MRNFYSCPEFSVTLHFLVPPVVHMSAEGSPALKSATTTSAVSSGSAAADTVDSERPSRDAPGKAAPASVEPEPAPATAVQVEHPPLSPFHCTVCLSPFDDNNHAPRHTPCCRRLLCGKCAHAVVSHPTPPPCCFCSKVPSSAITMASFVVDVGLMDTAVLDPATASLTYVTNTNILVMGACVALALASYRWSTAGEGGVPICYRRHVAVCCCVRRAKHDRAFV